MACGFRGFGALGFGWGLRDLGFGGLFRGLEVARVWERGEGVRSVEALEGLLIN